MVPEVLAHILSVVVTFNRLDQYLWNDLKRKEKIQGKTGSKEYDEKKNPVPF